MSRSDWKHLRPSNRREPEPDRLTFFELVLVNVGAAVIAIALMYGLMWYALCQATGGV